METRGLMLPCDGPVSGLFHTAFADGWTPATSRHSGSVWRRWASC